jgi:hypothetical protein
MKKFVRAGRAPHLQRRAGRVRAASACSTSPSAACSGCEDGGLELIEIAPGIDLERDILAQMDFTPAISPDLRLMDARCSPPTPMGLRERLLTLPLARAHRVRRARARAVHQLRRPARDDSAPTSPRSRRTVARPRAAAGPQV